MSVFVNPNADAFERVIDEFYVDMTGLIGVTNRIFSGPNNLVCATRPRRFGKTFAANMLAAYYSKGADSGDLFRQFAVSRDPTFEKNLNAADVLFWSMAEFSDMSRIQADVGDCVDVLQAVICEELRSEYPDICTTPDNYIPSLLTEINQITGNRFVIIIDEWDVVFREFPDNCALQDKYLHFLRGLFKGVMPSHYLLGAYMTGILPIKKTGTQSSLSDFDEDTMIDPGVMAPFVGFTKDQVAKLCCSAGMDFWTMQDWYDGYRFPDVGHVFCPYSVIKAVRSNKFKDFWARTEAHESLLRFINLDIDGLKDALSGLIDGRPQPVNAASFRNDFTAFSCRDDVLTLLVHLGYLSYDGETSNVAIPNKEIRDDFVLAMSQSNRKKTAE